MPSAVDVRECLAQAGFIPRELPRADVWRWQQRWRELYARELKAATGKWVYPSHDWHTFSLQYWPGREGGAARRAFDKVDPVDFVVVSGWAGDDFGFEATGRPPSLELGLDLLVFPRTLEWTMAYTHEEDHGPFFAPAGL